MMAAALDHLWRSTLATLSVSPGALAFSKTRPTVRHGLWFAASAKILVPFTSVVMLSLLALDATPAHASSPAITVAPVTVRAAPPTHSQVLKQSRSFVQSYAAAPNPELGQLARWRDPVCVGVFGLNPEQTATAVARIGDVAKAVGVKLDRPGCKANIEIVFTLQPQDLLDWVAEHDDWVLGFHYPSQTKALKAVTRPIQAWYMTSSRGGASDDAALAFNPTNPVPPGVGLGFPNAKMQTEVLDTPRNGIPNGCGGSHFTSCLSSLFNNVLLVVDAGRVRDRPLAPLIDYLAMLALSQPRSLDGCMAVPSVLDLLGPVPCPGRDPPDGLTPADASYLTALYAADLEAKRAGEQSDIAERMANILINAGATGGTTPK